MADEFGQLTAADLVAEFMAQFLDPGTSKFLANAFGQGLQSYTHNTVGMPGGGVMPLAPGALFAGPNAIEAQGANMFMQQAINAQMAESARVAEGMRLDIRNGVSQSLFGVQAPSTDFSLLNVASDMFLFGSLGLGDFTRNFQTAGRYMGVTAPVLSSDTGFVRRAGQDFTGVSAFLTADLGRNIQEYGGLNAGEVGTLASDLARTGAFTGLDLGDLEGRDFSSFAAGDASDITGPAAEKLRQVQAQIRSASGLVSEFKRVFNTDVTGALDRINSLFGVDVAQTFSPERIDTLRRALPGTAMATGFTSAQVIGFGAAAQQQAQAAGFQDFMGGMSTGILSAQMFRAAAQSGENPFAFVNEQQFRDVIVRRATGAALSPLARDISGAAALIQRAGGDVSGFYSDISGMGEVTSADLARVTGFDESAIRSAGFSREARLLAESGQGTTAVLRNNASFIEDIRITSAARIAGISANDLRDRLGGRTATSDVLREILGDSTGDKIDRIFMQNAQAMGFQNTEAEDLFLRTASRNSRLANIIKDSQQLGALQERIGDATSAVGGWRAFAQLAQGGEGLGDLGEIVQNITGVKEVDAELLFGDKKFQVVDGDARAQAVRKLAIGAATSVAFTGRLGNRAATKAEMDAAKKLFSAKTKTERDAAIAEWESIAQNDPALSSEQFDLRATEVAAQLEEDLGYSLSASQAQAARDMAFLDQFAEIDDFLTISGDGEAEAESKLKGKLASLRANIGEAARAGKTYQLSKDDRELMRKARAEASRNDEIGGIKETAMDKVISLITQIVEKMGDMNVNKRGANQ